MKRIRKILFFFLISCVGVWLLTLGVYVEDDISNEFLVASSSPQLPGCAFKIRVTGDEKTSSGVPFLFLYRRTVRQFGLTLMVQCESSEIRELIVKDIVIDSEPRPPNPSLPIKLRKSSGGRTRSVFRSTLADQSLVLAENRCSVVIVCTAIMHDDIENEVTIDQVIPIQWERRWSFGWAMLLYYSQFSVLWLGLS